MKDNRGQIIAATIGAVAVIIAAIITVRFSHDPSPAPPSSPLPAVTPSPPRTPPPGVVSFAVGQITSPSDNTQVPIEVSVSGTAARLASDHELRLFVEFIQDERFFPGEGAIALQPDGQWTAQINVGGPGQAGQQFKLNLVDLGPEAIERIQIYFRTERETGNVVGLSRNDLDVLGAKFLDAVTVDRV